MIRPLLALTILPLPALADVPQVMTDIAPIHSLTAQVMGNLGAPDLLLPPGADPHDFALRPSDAARLGEADLVIWVGESLTPWLVEPLTTLAPQAALVSLIDAPGWDMLEVREEVGAHGNHDDHDEHDEHDEHSDHDDHSDHDHDAGHDDDDHSGHEDHDDHEGHDHGDFDPHAWMDPSVAATWLDSIAAQLGQVDPENAPTYAANAAAAILTLEALEQTITAQLVGFSDTAYVLPHDGYQYFEKRFGLNAQATIAGIDGRTPGPAQIAAIREQMSDSNVVCVFSDAAIGTRWADVVTEGTQANTTDIDGIGVGLTAGPALYNEMLTRLADNFAQCLSPAS